MLGTIAYALVATLGLGALLWFGSDRRVQPSAAWPLALAWCWGIELFQLTPLPLQWERGWSGWHLVFGSTFDWADMALYPVGVALGALVLLGVERLAGTRGARIAHAGNGRPHDETPPQNPKRLLLRWGSGAVLCATALALSWLLLSSALETAGFQPDPVGEEYAASARTVAAALAPVAVMSALACLATFAVRPDRAASPPARRLAAFLSLPLVVVVGLGAWVAAVEQPERETARRSLAAAEAEWEHTRESPTPTPPLPRPFSTPTATVPPPSADPSEPVESAGPTVSAQRGCTQEDLRYTLEGAEPVMPGNGAGTLSAKNVSATACWVQGRPLLRIDQGGRTLALTSGAPEVIAGPGEDRRVDLAPGAKAWAQLGWRGYRAADREQELPQTLLVSLSDARSPVAAGFAPSLQAGPHPFDLVDGGHLGVSTFSSSAPR